MKGKQKVKFKGMLHLTNELALKLLILMEFARKVGMVGMA